VTREPPGTDWSGNKELLPFAAIRYVGRVCEPLVLADAVADDRFGNEPCFAGAQRCSLMLAPVMRQGEALAIIVLENRQRRGAFNAASMEAVMAFAGYLAVPLEAMRLNELLLSKVDERQRQIREAEAQLLEAARRSGMALIAVNVLHNVGNVLTSVNVSTRMLTERVRASRMARVGDLAGLLANRKDLARFMVEDPRGRIVPKYLRDLSDALQAERNELSDELDRLGASVQRIAHLVSVQQSYAASESDH